MALDSNSTVPTGSVLDDVAYLVRSDHRVPILAAMAVRPRRRAELLALTGVSSSTLRRTLRAFEDRDWIRRAGPDYETTPLGTFVASTMNELLERIAIERRLRSVWHVLPGEASGFEVDFCLNAVVTVAGPDDPYSPINRFGSLLDETDEIRFAGAELALLEPCTDELRRRLRDGATVEFVGSPAIVNELRSTAFDRCTEPQSNGTVLVLSREELPSYGLGLFDERIAISCSDRETGTVRVLIDTDAPAAREWAESAYGPLRRKAHPSPVEAIPR